MHRYQLQRWVMVFILGMMETCRLLSAGTPILPLSEVRPGMSGHWETVIEGTQITRFNLRILDTVGNHCGPQQPVIFAAATDPDQIAIGSVAGMSGSPVYINGKLVGAYSQGFNWAKNQAIVGIMPIEKMLEILDYPDEDALSNRSTLSQPIATDSQGLQNKLFTSFSPEVIAAFEDDFKKLGLRGHSFPMAAAASADELEAMKKIPIGPGTAIIAALMTGDFCSGGVGTLTWREQDRVLAFGHSYKKDGPTALPMALASIVTVVNQYEAPYKFAKFGPIVGMFTQDRLTGIAGRLGAFAPTTALDFCVQTELHKTRTYHSELAWHKAFGPVMAGTAALQSICSTIDAGSDQTYKIKMRWHIRGWPVFERSDTCCDPQAFSQGVRGDFDALLSNSFEPARIERVEFDIKTLPGKRYCKLACVRILDRRVTAGSLLKVTFALASSYGPLNEHSVEVPIPAHLTPSDEIELVILDAGKLQEAQWGDLPRVDFTGLGNIIAAIKDRKDYGNVYVQLRQRLPGIQSQGMNLTGLPPSAMARFSSPQTYGPQNYLTEHVLWECATALDNCVFEGQHIQRISIASP